MLTFVTTTVVAIVVAFASDVTVEILVVVKRNTERRVMTALLTMISRTTVKVKTLLRGAV